MQVLIRQVYLLCTCSSVVEQRTFNPFVVGSNPIRYTLSFYLRVLYCQLSGENIRLITGRPQVRIRNSVFTAFAVRIISTLKYMHMQYNGQYNWLPTSRCEFDSHHMLYITQIGPSPSGKAEGFDPLTSLVRIQLALWIPDGYHKASAGHGTKTLRMAIADVLHRYSGV